MKGFPLSFALIIGLLTSASTAMAQTVNMNSYITLTVGSGESIKLNFLAAAVGTPVRIVSGSNTQDITVGTNWTGTSTYTAGSTTMTIYGDLTGFDCSYNAANLTALDPSHNTQLKWLNCSYNQISGLDVSKNTQLISLDCSNNNLTTLDVSKNTQLGNLVCFGNNFTTSALDDIYCALPDRTGKVNGVIYPAYFSSSSNNAIVLATNRANATAKNWKVQYFDDNTYADVPTTGTYRCPPTTYDLWIAGVQVTSANCSDLSVIPDVTGTVKYDPATKVLTLDGATIRKTNTSAAIKSSIDGLTIKVIGTNTLTTSKTTLYFEKPLTITGGGVLNANSGTTCAIFANEINLTIDGCTVNAKGIWGISGNNASSKTLTIKSSTVTAEGTEGSITNFAGITLDGCTITEPEGAAFDASLKAIALNGQKVKSKVVIIPALSNMSRYITLTVKQYSAIKLNFKAVANGTHVSIVNGSTMQDIIVDTDWYGTTSYTAGSTEMKVYGDIIGFDCSDNGANLTALDVSHNTQLRKLYCRDNSLSSLNVSKNTELKGLYCYGNSFSTSALDDIYCALPVRSASDNAEIVPVESTSAPNHATVIATNAQNATAKNWKVLYSNNSADITTTGSYVCPQLNMSRYITLTVTNGAAIKLDLLAASAGTPIRIVSGSNTQDITVGTDWYDGNVPSTFTITAAASTMTIYGDLTGFACEENGVNLTSLDPSHNTQLTGLYCNNNNLSSLDVSKNTQLTGLFCHGNNFSTAALDDIFCALPDRTGKGNGLIEPVYSDTSSNHAIVLATNKANAIAKNWKVQYYKNDADIPATTGSYVCSGGGTTTYDLEIAGVQVTAANCSDLSVIPDVSGTVQYDPVAKVLTLQNATIQINTTNAIVSKIDDLTVKVIGTSNLTTDGSATMSFSTTATITGGGTLNAKSNTDCAIYANKTNLTIDGCTVNAKGAYGIAGKDGSSEKLTIKNSTVTAEGTSGSIADFASLTLDGCAITEPVGAAFDASLHAIALGGAKVTSKVVISPTGGEPNMNSYITLTVANGAAIKLNFKAAAEGTPVRIVSGSNTQDITVGTSWYGTATYTADGTTMTIYGDIIGFGCNDNRANLTALDPSQNTQLKVLECLSNQLAILDVSQNTQLEKLYCQGNTLTSLDVSKNTQLILLNCYSNTLSSLDVSKNTQLQELYCHSNNFSTAALDDIYCALPDRTGKESGAIQPVYSDTSSNHAIVLATNKANAIAKNWKVQYYADDTDIPPTTGKHKCPTTTDISEAAAEPALTLYPNPVADVLYLSATARTIRVYDIYGIEVAHAADTDRVEVSHLPAGVYTVNADGTVAKMVKR